MKPRITQNVTTVTVATDQNAVSIDASAHTLLVDSPTFGVLELGASLAGVAAATGIALDDVEASSGERELADALTRALESAAAKAEFGCPTDRFKDRGLRWTPLAYSKKFLSSQF